LLEHTLWQAVLSVQNVHLVTSAHQQQQQHKQNVPKVSTARAGLMHVLNVQQVMNVLQFMMTQSYSASVAFIPRQVPNIVPSVKLEKNVLIIMLKVLTVTLATTAWVALLLVDNALQVTHVLIPQLTLSYALKVSLVPQVQQHAQIV
jgi:hypothetical protein